MLFFGTFLYIRILFLVGNRSRYRAKLQKMLQLNLPAYNFRLKKERDTYWIFDNIRKKFVKLTPEEWVRQNFIRFFTEEKHFPASHLSVEEEIIWNGMKKRCDAIFYNEYAEPALILEFKAPQITISQLVFDQVAVYNVKLNVNFFIISNGIEHFFCKVNVKNSQFEISREIPNYKTFIELNRQ